MIDRCWQLGEENPILFIHDVGAGGLSNAMPELVHDGERGGKFDYAQFFAMKKACRHWKFGVTNRKNVMY